MPAINLDEIVPEDITFTFKGAEYVIPGDLDVDTTFDLIGLFGRFADAEAEGNIGAVRDINRELEARLLGLFKLSDPTLETLPFGVIAYRHVLGSVLQALGLQLVGDEEDPPTTAPAKARSTRSTGSARSGSTTGSAPAGGKASRS